ncbi:MAG: sensor histidine kinase [Rhodopila sp.]
MVSLSPREPDSLLANMYGRSARWLVPLLYLLSAAAFVADIKRDNTLAYGVIYTPLVATALFHRGRAGLWILTVATCILVIVGAFVPVVNPDLPDLIGNRILSIMAILATAAFVHHARAIRDRLAAQTSRAEAAERIKSEVLANLSREMRIPLRTLLSLLRLMMVDCRPDHREALARVRNGGRQLLDTIDNLIDLTQIASRRLRCDTMNVQTILRDAVESARSAAEERQIAIALNPSDDDAMALGDPWATRRILDNLIANAIRFAPPGGTVSVAAAVTADTVTASVSDTGDGLSPRLTRLFRDGAFEVDDNQMPATGGTGLVLSNRLAREMNGRLTVTNRPGAGATVSLSLPAA